MLKCWSSGTERLFSVFLPTLKKGCISFKQMLIIWPWSGPSRTCIVTLIPSIYSWNYIYYIYLFNYILIRSHFDNHPNNYLFVFTYFNKCSCWAFCILQIEILFTKFDFCVGTGYTFLHYYDLIHGMSTNFTSLFIEFIVCALRTFCRDDNNFVFNLE